MVIDTDRIGKQRTLVELRKMNRVRRMDRRTGGSDNMDYLNNYLRDT